MERRVLSIQSHVVHGYVGNKSAVFPLQLLGFDVDFVNSVQFSNHTGYSAGFKGQVLNGEQLEVLMSGLTANQLLGGTSHLLTGYIGSVTFLRAVASAHAQLKACNPNLVYVCDPVLGDNGKLYVPPELVDVYRSELIALATVLTPNQFEAELLTGFKVESLQDAVAACLWLHEKGPETVIITSLEEGTDSSSSSSSNQGSIGNISRGGIIIVVAVGVGGGVSGGGSGGGGGVITMLASTKRKETVAGGAGAGGNEGGAVGGGGEAKGCAHEMWVLRIPKLPGAYTGTGDLTAALFLAHLHATPSPDAPPTPSPLTHAHSSATTQPSPPPPPEAAATGSSPHRDHRHRELVPLAMRSVAASLSAVIQRTLSAAGPGAELRLVQSKRDLENPDTSGFIPERVAESVIARAQQQRGL
mmetsp:Transcript_67503/g.126245  ORF Transcript_67503/g.126245 Transcript_67503/m.126245 type:complete len:415 (-) Transcript_67503:241-1485(-)